MEEVTRRSFSLQIGPFEKHAREIQTLMIQCFEGFDEWLDEKEFEGIVAGYHDPEQCLWFLLHQSDLEDEINTLDAHKNPNITLFNADYSHKKTSDIPDPSDSSSSSRPSSSLTSPQSSSSTIGLGYGGGFSLQEEKSPLISSYHHNSELVGLATAVPYHDSLYVFNLCVHPKHRRKGIGSYLLHCIHHEAYKRGLRALSGTVDANATHLQQYYKKLGAKVLNDNSSMSGASRPCSIRLRKDFEYDIDPDRELVEQLTIRREEKIVGELWEGIACVFVSLCFESIVEHIGM